MLEAIVYKHHKRNDPEEGREEVPSSTSEITDCRRGKSSNLHDL